MGDSTTDTVHPIKVSGETWRQLNKMKRPGDSFEDVVRRLLAEPNDADASN